MTPTPTNTDEITSANRELTVLAGKFKQVAQYVRSKVFSCKNQVAAGTFPVEINFDERQLRATELVPYLSVGQLVNGAWHDTLLRSIADIITQNIAQPLRTLLCVYGGTAAGKTGLMSALFYILPVVTYLTSGKKKKQIPVLCLASNTEVRSWFLLDMETRSILLRAINVTYKGETINVYDFWHGEVFSFKSNERWHVDYVIMREGYGYDRFIKALAVIRKIADTYLLLVDEVQHGIKKDSLLDQLLTELALAFGGVHRGRHILFSATPSVLLAAHHFFNDAESYFIEMWVKAKHYLGPRGFLSLAMWDIDTNEKAITKIWQMEEYSFLNFDWDEADSNRWYKQRNAKWKVAVQSVTRAITTLAIEKETGVLVKLARRNVQADHYTKQMWATIMSMGRNATSKMVLILNYSTKLIVVDANGKYEYDRKETSSREIIEELQGKGLVPIIAVVGRSKWGDQYPATVTHFIDLTKEPTSWQTYIQGLPGRASGYGKSSVLIMSAEAKRKLKHWIDNDGADLNGEMTLAHDVTHIDNAATRETGSLRLTFRPSEDLNEINTALSPLIRNYGNAKNQILNLCTQFKLAIGADQTHPKHGSRNALLHKLDLEFLPRIAEELGMPLALPGCEIVKRNRDGNETTVRMHTENGNIFPRLDFNNTVWQGLASEAGHRGSKHAGGVQDAIAYHPIRCKECGRNTADVMFALLMPLNRQDKRTAALLRLRNALHAELGVTHITRKGWLICAVPSTPKPLCSSRKSIEHHPGRLSKDRHAVNGPSVIICPRPMSWKYVLVLVTLMLDRQNKSTIRRIMVRGGPVQSLSLRLSTEMVLM